MHSDSFSRLSESMMDEILSWNPAQATKLGWHKYDEQMRNPNPEAYSHQSRRLKEFAELLEGIPDSELGPEDLLDRDLALYMLRLRIFEITVLRQHERMSLFADEVGDSLFFLFFRDHLPLDTRMTRLAARMEKIPKFAEESKRLLVSPCKLWNEISLRTGMGLPGFIDLIVQTARKTLKDAGVMRRLELASDAAVKSIEDYNAWLDDEILPSSDPNHAIPEQIFDEYLEMKRFGATGQEALSIAEKALDVIDSKMKETARAIVPSGDPREALRIMKANHPRSFTEALEEYRKSIHDARAFVSRKELATIPHGETLIVMETPNFMRHTTPFAAQLEPGKFTSGKAGLFLVTPDETNPALLKEHSHAAIANTSVHEGYPGHHLQGICGNEHPSYVRVMCMAPDFAEGWALYCEDLMISSGYNDTPMGRLAQLVDLRFRVVRVIAEVKLATHEMSVDEVAQMLMRECEMDPEAAVMEASTYTYCPTYFLSYFIGKLRLMQLREDVEKAMGRGFSLKFFHDTMLYAGCLPIEFIRRALDIRLRKERGIALGEPSESLHSYAMRTLAEGRV